MSKCLMREQNEITGENKAQEKIYTWKGRRQTLEATATRDKGA